MGCDIHAVFQAKRNGKWEDVSSGFEENRHYFLFSWLADVRNGFGFAGVATYSPVTPIAQPRGLPADFDADADEHNGKWLGDHSHSWLTADEILATPTPSKVWQTGIVPVEWFRAWDGRTQPHTWSGGISGGGVHVAESPVDVDEKTTHVRIYWLREDDPLAYFTDEIKLLRDQHGEVRMVFGFDS